MVRKYVEAREKRDPVLIAALFTADADQVTTAGEWRRGRDNVVKGGLASSQSNPGSRDIAIEAVRFLAPAVAIADGRYEIRGAQDSAAAADVDDLRPDQGRLRPWRVAAIRNMAPTRSESMKNLCQVARRGRDRYHLAPDDPEQTGDCGDGGTRDVERDRDRAGDAAAGRRRRRGHLPAADAAGRSLRRTSRS